MGRDEIAQARSARRNTPRTEKRRRNRRRINLPRILLKLSLFLLAAECLVVLLFSPRLWVRTVRIEGERTVSASRLFERMRLQPRTNILRLPARPIRERLEREPAIAHAEVHRRLPDTVIVRVRERTPWATVKVGGVCYTVDEDLVPFRKGRMPEVGLPIVVLEGNETDLRLGKQLLQLGVREATRCLQWASARDDFPITAVRVDQTGKLCLNRDGGAEIRLGSAMDLGKKLDALANLLAQREDVRNGSFAYINLYAFDAPAILPKPPVGGRSRSDFAASVYRGDGTSVPPDR